MKRLVNATNMSGAVAILLAIMHTGCNSTSSDAGPAVVRDSARGVTSSAAEKLDAGFRTVPTDTLTDQEGRRVSLRSLRGKVWVADFIFTRCAGPCPMMSVRMSQLQKDFEDSGDVTLVSFSVDPVYDTPERLKTYATKYGADNKRWFFLTTGDKNKIWDLAMKGFALTAGEDTTRDGRGMIFHDERLVIVDRSGEIRGYVHTKDASWREKTKSRVRELLAERNVHHK